MQQYENISGNSGVEAFEIGDDEIIIRFVNGRTYRYDYAKTGERRVEIMKALAISGQGLSTYIGRHVRDTHAEELTTV